MMEANYRYPGFYIFEPWTTPKERFKELSRLIAAKPGYAKANVLDVGCATGELINYLSTCYPRMTFTGVDNYQPYILEAKQRNPLDEFQVASVLNLPEKFTEQFDLVLGMGILGIFDEHEAQLAFDNLLRCAKKGRRVFVFSHFNDNPIDVIVKHRRTDVTGAWESGWNIYSRETISNILHGQCESVQFHEFKLPFYLPPNLEDPVRSFTVETFNNPYQLTNGLKLWIDFYFLEIVK